MALAALLALAGCGDGGGSGSGAAASTTWVHHWNQIAIDASGLDHTPPAPGETRVFGEQLGPGRAARAMAIVHIAVFDAMIAIEGGYESYTGIARVQGTASMEAAIAEAAYETLGALFPSQEQTFHAELEDELAAIGDGPVKDRGIDAGHRAAAAILALRADDGSQHAEPRYGSEYIAGDAPGEWRQDPISQHPLALGALWGGVRPFVLESGDQFRVPAPPALDSAAHAAAYAEVQSLGGDKRRHPQRAHRRGDPHRHLLGLRRHAEPLRAAAHVQPDHRPDRRAAGDDGDGVRPPAGAGQRRHGGYRHRRLGVEIPLQVLAPGDRHPRVRPRHRSHRPRRSPDYS